MKRELTLLVMVLLLSLVASAEDVTIDGLNYHLYSATKTASVAKWTTSEYTAEITIPKAVKYDGITYSVTSISSSAFSKCKGLTSVKFLGDIQEIEAFAFSGCTSLSDISVPSSVTAIWEYAFQSCAFSSFVIPDGVTVISEGAFSRNTKLSSITIPDNVKIIEKDAFTNCTNLRSITIPDKVTEIGEGAFNYMNLRTIVIGKGVKSIGTHAFYHTIDIRQIYCSASEPPTIDDYVFAYSVQHGNLSRDPAILYVPEESVEKYKSAEYWKEFESIEALKYGDPGYTPPAGLSINEENFPDENFRKYLTSQSYGRDGVITDAELAELTSISCSRRNISSVKGIEHFTSLETLTVDGNPLFTLDVSVFTKLKTLSISDTKISSIDVSKNEKLTRLQCANTQTKRLDLSNNKALSALICYNNELQELDLSSNKSIYTLYCYGNQIKGTAMDRFIASLRETTDKKIRLITNVDEGNVCTPAQVAAAISRGWTPLQYDGKDWVAMTAEESKPTYNDGDIFTAQTVEGVTMTFRVTSLDPMECEVGDGTQACISTGTSGEVTIPAMPRGFVTRKIADYGFAKCSQMKRCWVNDSIWYIGAHAFDGCTALTTIDLPKEIKEVSPLFVDHPVTVNVPTTASPTVRNSITEACERTGSSVTARRTDPKEVEERVYIWPQVRGFEDHFIANCESVGWIVVDEANPYFDSRNNCNAIIRTSDNTLLFGCKRTNIPETVVAIAPYAFEGHRRLERLTLPAGLQSIGESAFVDCSGITTVKSFIEMPFAINDNTFSDVTYHTATLTVPNGTKALYQATAGWKNFVQIEEMPQTISSSGNADDSDNGQTVGYWFDEEAVEYLAILISGYDAEGDVHIEGYRQILNWDPVKVIAIADGAFENNENIKSVRIPGTILTIGRYAFAYCTELKAIYVYAYDFVPAFHKQVVGEVVPPVSTASSRAVKKASDDAVTAFEGINLNEVTLYVPYGCRSLYENADGWNLFANIVEMTKEESAINGVLVDQPVIGSNAVYDLQGRRMDKSSLLKKGIYIQNGRKVVVK
mgnify:CR=1 FL=1